MDFFHALYTPVDARPSRTNVHERLEGEFFGDCGTLEGRATR